MQISFTNHFFREPLGDGHFTFPNIEKLCDVAVEKQLRDSGFGYRAKYIQKAASQIVDNGGEKWLNELTKMDYKNAHQQLCTLYGIGPKVGTPIFLFC